MRATCCGLLIVDVLMAQVLIIAIVFAPCTTSHIFLVWRDFKCVLAFCRGAEVQVSRVSICTTFEPAWCGVDEERELSILNRLFMYGK